MNTACICLAASCLLAPGDLDLPVGTWVKLSPLETTPASPRLGYEGACAWDGIRGVFIRYGGHNQGGGGEQGSEVWTFEPTTATWTLEEPNVSPPGVCCAQQNVFDPVRGRYIRFPSFSGSHGWQWWREIYLNDSSVWTYDISESRWRDLRPIPTPSPKPLRCASWDTHHEVVVLFGGETSREGTLVYDPHSNTWTRMRPSPEPDFRSGGNMTYDEARRLHILFGSQFSDDPHTWAYDLRKNEWRDLEPESLPPTNRNDAVVAYDRSSRKIVAVVRIEEGEGDEENRSVRLETWLYDAGANRWSRLETEPEPPPSGSRARVLVAAPELNALLLENRTHPPLGPREQQIWALRLAEEPEEATRDAGGLEVLTSYGEARIRWRPSRGAQAADLIWKVFRGQGEHPWNVDLEELADRTLESRGRRSPRRGRRAAYQVTDTGLAAGTVYYYQVRGFHPDGTPGPRSRIVRTRPAIVDGLVVSVISESRVELAWRPSPEPDVFGYLVERAPVRVLSEDELVRLKRVTRPLDEPSVGAITGVGRFERVTRAPVRGTRYADTGIDLRRPSTLSEGLLYERSFHEEHRDPEGKSTTRAVYAYRVRAINELGTESGPSAAVFTIPSRPQHLFSRESGTTCDLKWAPNPERGIQGYRVYRMDGRWNSDPVPRLTPQPISKTTFSDPGAGSHTRRYYVVAVDTLGQEGFPSSPVWFDREWKAFYAPFTGEWHQ